MATNITSREVETATIIDSADPNNIYVGEAKIGASKSSAVWQISKLVKSGTDFEVQLADSNLRFDNIWDNRASLTYGL